MTALPANMHATAAVQNCRAYLNIPCNHTEQKGVNKADPILFAEMIQAEKKTRHILNINSIQFSTALSKARRMVPVMRI